jgi:hypothetical protein
MASKRKKPIKTVAKLEIRSPGKMTLNERCDTVEWLLDMTWRLHKKKLTKGKFRAGFHYI